MTKPKAGEKEMKIQIIISLSELEEGKFYRVADLQSVLKNLNLNFSMYTVRDYETWKCLDYKCGKRSIKAVDFCPKCGGKVRPPLIPSPRTIGGGKGWGHRRYTAGEIRGIVEVFQKRSFLETRKGTKFYFKFPWLKGKMKPNTLNKQMKKLWKKICDFFNFCVWYY